MKKTTIYVICTLLFAGLVLLGCTKEKEPIDPDTPDTEKPEKPEKPEEPEEPEEPTQSLRFSFDYVQLSEKLNSDFAAVCNEYQEYAYPAEKSSETFEAGAYVKIENDSLLLKVTFEKDVYGKVNRISSVLESDDVTSVMGIWSYYLKNAENLKLGQFLGTKYKNPGGAGICQSIDETMSRVNSGNMKDTEAFTIFGVIPLNAYAVVGMEYGHFTAYVLNSYFVVDHPELRKLIGTSHSDFFNENRIVGNKINMFGDIYVYFDYAKDLHDNIFTVSVHADSDMKNIAEIDLYVNLDHNDEAQQMNIWKAYASHPEAMGIGSFKRAFRTDKDGGKRQSFSNMDEVIAYVDANGRPQKDQGGIIAVFEADGLVTNLVMNADFIYMLIKHDDVAETERYPFDAQDLAMMVDTDFRTFMHENQKYLPEFVDGNLKDNEFEIAGYMKTDADSVLLSIIAVEENQKIHHFSVKLEDEKMTDSFWKYCLNNADILNFGGFQGTKYRGQSGSGLHQKIEDTMNYIDANGKEGNEMYSIFNTLPYETHSVVELVDGNFGIRFIKCYIEIELADIDQLIGADFNEFAEKYYLVGNKVNMFGSSYFNFSAARDNANRIFSGKVTPDGDQKIKTIELWVDANLQDANQQMNIWRNLVEKPQENGIGAFKNAYTCDNWGTEKSTFNSADEVIEFINANGRPKSDFDDGVVVVFQKENINITLLLNSKEIKLTIAAN